MLGRWVGDMGDPLGDEVRQRPYPSSSETGILEAVEYRLVLDPTVLVGHRADNVRQAAVLPECLAQLGITKTDEINCR